MTAEREHPQPTIVVRDLRLNRRGYVVSYNAVVVLVQWYDRPGVQTIPAPSFTDDRYDVRVDVVTR